MTGENRTNNNREITRSERLANVEYAASVMDLASEDAKMK